MNKGYCRSPTEELIFHTNPRMIYADKPYYDFLLSRKFSGKVEFPHYIKIEVLTTMLGEYDHTMNHRIAFRITKGEWRKALRADYIVAKDDRRIYFGVVSQLNAYIEKNMSASIRMRSFQPWSKKGGRTYFRRSVRNLQSRGLLCSIPISQAHKLELLIQQDYESRNPNT